MTIDMTKLPQSLHGCLNDRGFADGDIAQMSPSEVFEAWCEWQGIINWANRLEDTLDTIRNCSPEWMKANGLVTMTYNDKGEMVAVTRRDIEDKIVATLWEKK